MHGVMIAAVSQDGFITDRFGNYKNWVSSEDQKQYKKRIVNYKLQFMGTGTYNADKPKPKNGILRVVLTRNPAKYEDESIPGKIVFENLTPDQAVNKYASYRTFALVGGGYVYESFMQARLIDEAYITIEPVKLTQGIPLFSGDMTLKKLEILAVNVTETKLNNRGATLRHYILKQP